MITVDTKKEKALAALLTSSTQQEAAAKCGLSDRTLRQYMQDDEFAHEYAQRRQELLTAATAQLQQSLAAAVAALRSVVEADGSSDSARISAGRVLLEYGLRYSELTDLYQRLSTVEAALRQGGGDI